MTNLPGLAPTLRHAAALPRDDVDEVPVPVHDLQATILHLPRNPRHRRQTPTVHDPVAP